ncbi:MAG: hypothetical protein RIK87_04115 [Fuerstiella sp.]
MIIRRDLLTALPKERPAFESPHHHIRWETLLQLAATYAQQPWQFLDVEIVVQR